MATTWTAIENAIQTIVKSASGFDGPHCYWDDQNVTQPAGPFITLHMGDVIPKGIDYENVSINHDGTVGVDDVSLRVVGSREFTVLLQAHVPPGGGYTGPAFGASSARAVLSRVNTTFASSVSIAALQTAECSCFDPGTVSYVGELVGTVFKGRATLTMRFYAREIVETFTTSIETVSPVTGTISS